MNSTLLVADQRIIEFHNRVQEFAVLVNTKTSQKEHDHPFAGGALYSIGADALALHRAVLSLCSSGWAFATLILLRTILELLASTVVIYKAGKDPEQHADFMGFKYLLSWAKVRLSDPSLSDQERESIRAEIDRSLAELEKIDPKLQEIGKAFIFKQRLKKFWWNPEFSGGPMDIFEGYWSKPDQFYGTLSSASHGGLTGLRFFKDNPEDVHPEPRQDARSQNGALASSCRLLLEMCGLRSDFEKCGTTAEYLKLQKECLQLKQIVAV